VLRHEVRDHHIVDVFRLVTEEGELGNRILVGFLLRVEAFRTLPVGESGEVLEVLVLVSQIEDDLGLGVVDEELAVADPVGAGLVFLPCLVDRAEMPVEGPLRVEESAVE